MILDRILQHKKKELRNKQSRAYLADLKSKIRDGKPPAGFAITLNASRSEKSPALIAEVKKASPSLGLLRKEFSDHFDHQAIARTYHEYGASAISVLTDKEFFQGDLRFLAEIKKAVPVPVLNKEFMVGEIQFYEARANGADAVLLIVAALEQHQLTDFYAQASELGMDCLVEVHEERELDLVLERLSGVRMIGINNRDLHTFTSDLDVTFRLAKRIPGDKLIISESGIHTREDVMRLLKAGIHGMLIGEALICADHSGEKVWELLGRLPGDLHQI